MRAALIIILRLYQRTLSPNHGILRQIASSHGYGCRYYPTCSEYMRQGIEKYGCLKGIFLGIKRLSRCTPLHEGGHDPLL